MGLLDRILTEKFREEYERQKSPQPSLLGALKDPQFREDVKRGLLDSVNRGAVASTIGGPVDLATMALRPLGYNVEKPILGSEWVGDKMQQLGLLGNTRNPVAEALASVAVPGAMAKAGKGLFNAEQAAIQNANIAGPLTGGKLATQRGVFGGINAKTADKAKLAQAEQMLKKGVDPAQVWKETGWGRGPDGKWRFEIPDNKASLREYQFTPMEAYKDATFKSAIGDGDHTRALGMRDYAGMSKAQLQDEYRRTGETIVDAALSGDKELAKKLNADRQGLNDLLSQMGSRTYGPASSWLKHGDLGEAYPDVYKMHTRISPDDVGSAKAHYSRGNEHVGEQIVMGKKPIFNDDKSTMLHELQHAIQQREGFARGGSPESMQSLVRERESTKEAFDRALNQFMTTTDDVAKYNAGQEMTFYGTKLAKIPKVENAQDAYMKLGGEAEARLVQSRMNLTPEERAAQYPFNPDYFKQQTGVGIDDLIHRFDGGEAKSVGFTYPQEAALATAQRNAALPVSEGGLGLHPNNTPMERAQAMGFYDKEFFHATDQDFPAFDLSKAGNGATITKNERAAFLTDKPSVAGEYIANPYSLDKSGEIVRTYANGGNVMPLMVSSKKPTKWDMYGRGYESDFVSSAIKDAAKSKSDMVVFGQMKDPSFSTLGSGEASNIVAMRDPAKIRSRFAAFDPLRKHEADLLAGAMPFGLLADPELRQKLGQ